MKKPSSAPQRGPKGLTPTTQEARRRVKAPRLTRIPFPPPMREKKKSRVSSLTKEPAPAASVPESIRDWMAGGGAGTGEGFWRGYLGRRRRIPPPWGIGSGSSWRPWLLLPPSSRQAASPRALPILLPLFDSSLARLVSEPDLFPLGGLVRCGASATSRVGRSGTDAGLFGSVRCVLCPIKNSVQR